MMEILVEVENKYLTLATAFLAEHLPQVEECSFTGILLLWETYKAEKNRKIIQTYLEGGGEEDAKD